MSDGDVDELGGPKVETGAQSPDKSALFAVATDTGKPPEVESKPPGVQMQGETTMGCSGVSHSDA